MSRKLERNQPSRKITQKILIACEGSKTEPIYFNSIRNELRSPTLEIIVLRNKGKTDPGNIIEILIEKRQQIKYEKGWTKNDAAWAVFDGDEHINKSLTSWQNAINRANSQKINLAITNPCFELWYLIHFQEHLAEINCDKLVKLLNKHIPDYDKSMCLYPKPLKLITEIAIQSAEKIAKQIERDELYEYSNPCCSDLPKLISSLLDLK
ncbi:MULTISPECIES: RloB family protein [unclassified Anabaena]|uniref:RloB family protein n=1 Tax=unclassified Anabaena TaxID=2619674 RepID=UPI001447F419|nr:MULTISPECIES: RloB family protein [unclassified Anabaena]MTJ08848.1 RloB domain-containing protein [Anabaena sp. UHCC 0204]MTJ51208.1 RloB domain-containing protein [Anabaena sp. UHCC 0253]